ncbi:hypothetical protein CR513_36774, partial [Mucuna pruriens]
MECKLGTEKPKVTRGNRLDHQCTPVDLILSVLANEGEPSSLTMAIVVEDGTPNPGLVFSDSVASVLHSAEIKSDKSLPRPYQLSFCQEKLGQCRDESVLYTSGSTSSIDPLYAFDLEIELTLRKLRKTRNTVVNISSSSDSAINSNLLSANALVSSSNVFTEPGQMENNDRTLKELATLDVVYQPWCIQYPQLEPAQTYELKSGLIHLLPKFHGLAGEDPHKHLKEFHVVCSTMRPQGIPEDYIKMKALLFSLDGAAKDWLYLQPTLFNTWGDMKRTFLEKFFPASRTVTIKKEIYGIRQYAGETLHEY